MMPKQNILTFNILFMNPFSLLFDEIIYRPIINLLVVFLWLFDGNLGLAIVSLTVIIRLLLLKVTFAGNTMQQQMSDFQPKMAEIQERYKDDPKKLSEETMKLFKNQGMWPLKGCLMMLLQIPVFLWLYTVIQSFASNKLIESSLYSFLVVFGAGYLKPGSIDATFLGIDLLGAGSIVLAIVSWVLVYLQMQLTMLNKPVTPQMPGWAAIPDMSKMMGTMNIVMVGVMWSVVYSTNSGVWLYILITTLFSVVQYMIQYRQLVRAKWQARGIKGKK